MRTGIKRKYFLIFALMVVGLRATFCDESVRLGLTVNAAGILEKDGKPFRGIGVNYFDCFYRALKNPNDTSYENGLRALAENKIPFVRMIGCGFWPVDSKLYVENKEEYFRRFDAVVKCAEKNNVGLIPSLFWTAATVPDLVGETCDQWGNPQSKTHEYMRNYTREVVTRYLKSPAIWGWEFGNEYNLGANLPNAAQHRSPVHPTLGTAKSRSERDEWTYEMIRVAFAEFGKEVRRHDPRRIISTGDSILRPHAWHNWKEKSWKADTPDQFLEMLRGDNPDPISVISIHAYSENIARIAAAAQAAAQINKPLFIGEFGVEGAQTEKTEKEFATALAAIEQSKAPLAAVWVYDYKAQDTYNVTPTNARSWQIKAISEANARIRVELDKANAGK